MPVGDATARLNIADDTFADQRSAHYQANRPVMNGVRIPVLPIGDTLKFNATPRQTTAFPAFQTAFPALRCLGARDLLRTALDGLVANQLFERARGPQ